MLTATPATFAAIAAHTAEPIELAPGDYGDVLLHPWTLTTRPKLRGPDEGRDPMAQSHPYTGAERRRLHHPAGPRSFEPVNVDPITTNKPTNADLAKGFNQLHLCHEDTKAKVVEIQDALGITAGKKPVAGLSTPWKAFVRTVGAVITAIGGTILIYRLLVAAAPSVWAFMQALNHVILTGKF